MADTTAIHIRLFFVCIPRSGSTSMLKCLSFFQDSDVWFEPFVISRIARVEYRRNTGKVLPTTWDEEHAEEFDLAAKVVQASNKLPLVAGRKYAYSEVKRAIESSTKSVVIVKDMGTSLSGLFQYLPEPESGFKYVFIIRDPHLAISSYRRASVGAWQKLGGFSGDENDFNLFVDDPYYRDTGGCYMNTHSVWQHVRKNLDPNPLVIEMEDFTANPKPFIQKICEVGGLEYHDGLLEWDASTDVIKTWQNFGGVTRMLENSLGDFHQTAINSSGFHLKKGSREIPDRSCLHKDVLQAVDQGMKYYNEMHENRFLP